MSHVSLVLAPGGVLVWELGVDHIAVGDVGVLHSIVQTLAALDDPAVVDGRIADRDGPPPVARRAFAPYPEDTRTVVTS